MGRKRRRKKHPHKWVKRTERKRTCPSGKHPYAKPGEARAALPNAVVYTCEDCGKYHVADPVRRRARQARAQRGEL
jgi:transcription elongation factor Elf1